LPGAGVLLVALGGALRNIIEELQNNSHADFEQSSIIAIAQKIPGKVYEEARRHAVTRNAL